MAKISIWFNDGTVQKRTSAWEIEATATLTAVPDGLVTAVSAITSGMAGAYFFKDLAITQAAFSLTEAALGEKLLVVGEDEASQPVSLTIPAINTTLFDNVIVPFGTGATCKALADSMVGKLSNRYGKKWVSISSMRLLGTTL